MTMPRITPFLWFDGRAEEAARFYTSLFPNSSIRALEPWGGGGQFPSNWIRNATFELDGQPFYAFDAGPAFHFNPSISFFTMCEEKGATIALWEALLEGGSVLMPLQEYDWSPLYGWLTDRFGVSWQVCLGEVSHVGQRVSPSLLFTGPQSGKAEAAVHFYTSVFDKSSITAILKWGRGEGEVEGSVKHAQFALEDHVFMATDSGHPHGFTFNEAISFFVHCETQEDVDLYWNRLLDGGAPSRCGWLKDRFGVSWQVVPNALGRLLKEGDAAKRGRVMRKLMSMDKIIIQDLEEA